MTYRTHTVRSEAPRVKHENARAALKSQAVGITSTICMYLAIRKKQKITKEEKSIGVWENEVKASARKETNGKRKRGTFTEEKKRVM